MCENESNNIPFPYEPYPVQKQLMKAIYEAIENKNIGLFESPTGTGKSLSIICSALHWMLHGGAERALKAKFTEESKGSNGNKVVSDFPDWITDQSMASKMKVIEDLLKEYHIQEDTLKNRLLKRDQSVKLGKRRNKVPIDSLDKIDDFTAENTDFLLAGDVLDFEKDEEVLLPSTSSFRQYPQIIFCSRTHSQLVQFVNEIKKTKKDVRVVSLGSRKQLCVHPRVMGLSTVRMNEKCQDMQKAKSKSTKKVVTAFHTSVNSENNEEVSVSNCPYLSNESGAILSDEILSHVQDMEEIHKLGVSQGICAYYASRACVDSAHVITMPYASLLHEGTRESLGVSLKGNIVIIDEAHNIIESINEVYSTSISFDELCVAHSQLCQYFEKYRERLNFRNSTFVQQIISLLAKFKTHLVPLKSSDSVCCSKEDSKVNDIINTKMFTLNDFTLELKFELINLCEIISFFESSEISKKVMGFVNKYEGDDANKSVAFDSSNSNRHVSNLGRFRDFLKALNENDSDGRVSVQYVATVDRPMCYRYLMLNPGIHFLPILQEARSVLLCGGTMQPFDYYISQLMSIQGLDTSRLKTFSCGHVVNSENVLGLILGTGPTNVPLIFNLENRAKEKVMNELGNCLVNICKMVPYGIVCFFPSFNYESTVFAHFQKVGMLERIEQHKKIFREPRSSNELEKVLNDYSAHIENKHGAFLSSVVGGKMSEGINFSDNLARCVVMIGMPYPNKFDPELQEKMRYYDRISKTGVSFDGNAYYENLTFRAINQSIGRSIRHKNDAASIILLDQRFEKPSNIEQLPAWIRESIKINKFGECIGNLSKFYKEMKLKGIIM